MVAFTYKALNWRKIKSTDKGPLPCCFAFLVGREKIAKIDYNKCLVYVMHTIFLKCPKHNVYLVLAACGFHWALWNSPERIRNFSFPEFPAECPVFKKTGKNQTNYTEEKNLSPSQ